MKAKHKAIITKASKLRTELAEKVVEASKASATVGFLNEEIAELRSKISEVEAEAADSGLAVSDLHEALDEMRGAK